MCFHFLHSFSKILKYNCVKRVYSFFFHIKSTQWSDADLSYSTVNVFSKLFTIEYKVTAHNRTNYARNFQNKQFTFRRSLLFNIHSNTVCSILYSFTAWCSYGKFLMQNRHMKLELKKRPKKWMRWKKKKMKIMQTQQCCDSL